MADRMKKEEKKLIKVFNRSDEDYTDYFAMTRIGLGSDSSRLK